MLRTPLAGCRAGEVQLIGRSFTGGSQILPDVPQGQAVPNGRMQLLTSTNRVQPGLTLDVPPELSTVLIPSELSGVNGLQLHGTYLAPPALITDSAATHSRGIAVATDGTDDVVEAARSALGDSSTQTPPLTPAELLDQADQRIGAYRSTAFVGLAPSSWSAG